jgi:hypothetical protein
MELRPITSRVCSTRIRDRCRGADQDPGVRTSDLYVVKVTQRAQGGIRDDLAYTDPVFTTDIAIPVP